MALSSRPAKGKRHTHRIVVAGGGSVSVAIAELVSSGAGVLAVCADASRRAALASGATGLARFNGGSGRIACLRCGAAALEGVIARAEGGLALTDYTTLERGPANAAEHFEHVILVDPPPSAEVAELVASARREPGEAGAGEGAAGFLHSLWTDAELPFSLAALAERFPSRDGVARMYRALRDAGETSGEALRRVLAGTGGHPLAPEAAARSFRVLAELDLVSGEPNRGDGVVGVVSSEGTDLERSAAFRAYSDEFSETKRYLERRKQP